LSQQYSHITVTAVAVVRIGKNMDKIPNTFGCHLFGLRYKTETPTRNLHLLHKKKKANDAFTNHQSTLIHVLQLHTYYYT